MFEFQIYAQKDILIEIENKMNSIINSEQISKEQKEAIRNLVEIKKRKDPKLVLDFLDKLEKVLGRKTEKDENNENKFDKLLRDFRLNKIYMIELKSLQKKHEEDIIRKSRDLNVEGQSSVSKMIKQKDNIHGEIIL